MDESDIIDAILTPLDEESWQSILDRGIDYIYLLCGNVNIDSHYRMV